MLLRARGVFERYVRNRAVATYKVRTLAIVYGAGLCTPPRQKGIKRHQKQRKVEMENSSARTDLLVALEDVKPPPNKGLAKPQAVHCT